MKEVPIETLAVGTQNNFELLAIAAGLAGAVVAVFCVIGFFKPKH